MLKQYRELLKRFVTSKQE